MEERRNLTKQTLTNTKLRSTTVTDVKLALANSSLQDKVDGGRGEK